MKDSIKIKSLIGKRVEQRKDFYESVHFDGYCYEIVNAEIKLLSGELWLTLKRDFENDNLAIFFFFKDLITGKWSREMYSDQQGGEPYIYYRLEKEFKAYRKVILKYRFYKYLLKRVLPRLDNFKCYLVKHTSPTLIFILKCITLALILKLIL